MKTEGTPSDRLPAREQIGGKVAQPRLDRVAEIARESARFIGRNLPMPDERIRLVDHQIGQIVTAPAGSSEYTDARYWVQLSQPKTGLADAALLYPQSDNTVPTADLIVTATNLSEVTMSGSSFSSSTHLLTAGTPVHLFAVATDEIPSRLFWFFTAGGSSLMIPIKITGNCTGGGKYNARRMAVSAGTVSSTTTLAAADVGTASGSDDLMAMNLQEIGQSTHDVDYTGTQVYFIGLLLSGVKSNHSPARDVVVFDSSQWKNC